jgi:hypothetical protein
MSKSHRQSIIHASGQSSHRTPPEMASKLVSIFGCTVDLAASQESSVCGPFYMGPDQIEASFRDSMVYPWHTLTGHTTGFLNPPFSLDEIKELKEQAEHAPVENLEDRINALRVEKWAEKACTESLKGFTTIGVFPYAPQTDWFRTYVMGHSADGGWWGHAALDYWRLPHRVSFLTGTGEKQNNAGVNTCIIHWGPSPGFVGPWVPSGRYWSYR